MYMKWDKKRDQAFSVHLVAMAATALALLPRRGHAFHTITISNVGRICALRHASGSGSQAQQQQHKQRIRMGNQSFIGISTPSRSIAGASVVTGTSVRWVSYLTMAAQETPRSLGDFDRGFSNSGVIDTTFNNRHSSVESTPFSTSRGGGSSRRNDGDNWKGERNNDRDRRPRQEEWNSNHAGRRRGNHDRGFSQDERTKGWDERSKGDGGRRFGGSGGRGRSFKGRRDPSEGTAKGIDRRDQTRAGGNGRRGHAEASSGDISEGLERAGDGNGDGSTQASGWMRGALSNVREGVSPTEGAEDDTDFDMVYGIAPVLNALRNQRRKKLGLYCQDGLAPANKKDRAAANTIYDLARESDVMMTMTDKGYLNTLCSNRPHQGFILKACPLEFKPILFLPPIEIVDPRATAPASTGGNAEYAAGRGESGAEETTVATEDRVEEASPALLAAPARVWLALDEVTDPQNFGALLRSAHFFGVGGVVACAKNSASLTPTVSKASAGAAEVMQVHSTANMMRFLKRCRENGWRVVGTAVSESSVPLRELSAGPDAPPTVVVLGNEGYGVRANVLRECDVLVEVTGGGSGAVAEGAAASTVDSLNVSVTGGVVLFHLLAAAAR